METKTVEFNDFFFLALDHGIKSIKDSNSLVPFVLVKWHNDGNFLERFLVGKNQIDLQKSLQEAKKFIKKNHAKLKMYALVYDGIITIENQQRHAIIVEAEYMHTKNIVKIAQIYKKTGFLRKINQKVGNSIFID